MCTGVAAEASAGGLRGQVEAADVRRHVGDFAPIYERRPIAKNSGGMRFNHSFATWLMLRLLKPRFVIESGVWQGHSTWLIEQACPDAQIFCLDLDFSNLAFRSSRATYIQKDFSECTRPGIDPTATLCFFDDRQNAYQRLKDMRWASLARAIFEDNFPSQGGDCYSIRKVIDGSGHERVQLSSNWVGDARNQQRLKMMEDALWSIRTQQHLLVRANTTDRELFLSNCREYFEFPPVALNSTDDRGEPYEGNHRTETPIYSRDELPETLRHLMATDPIEFGYCNIAYVELR
jgi:hypothetical protein